MTVMKDNKYIYFFLIIVGVILFSPMNIYAKEVRCFYSSSDASSQYETTIYDDNTQHQNTSLVTRYYGKSHNQREQFKNGRNYLKKQVTSKSEELKCPNYAVIVHNKVGWQVYGYFSESDFNAKVESLKSKNKKYAVTYSTNNSEYAKNNVSNNNTSTNITKDTTSNSKNNSCKKILGKTNDPNSVAYLLQLLFNYVKVLGPILVIVFSSIDFTKTILSSDEKAMKNSQRKLGIRLLCAVGLYFLPTLVTLMINLVFGTSGNQVCGIK